MKKKIINGLLFAVALVAATSSFVSCKDYEGDNYADLNEKYATLQAAYLAQVSAMQDYVLTSKYEGEVGANYDKSKGTIQARLNALEKDTASLADRILKNNQAIVYATALAKADSARSWNDSIRIDKLQNAMQKAWGDDLEAAMLNAAKVAATVAKDSDKWNKAVEVADSAWNWIKSGKDAKDLEYKNLAEMIEDFKEADKALQDQIDALREEVDKILETLKKEVTGIIIQGTINPIYGTFYYPYGLDSKVLAMYYGETDKSGQDLYFPAAEKDKNWVYTYDDGVAPVLESELKAIKAPGFGGDKALRLKAGEIVMEEQEGNAGVLYLTINPSNVNFEGKEFTLRNSKNAVSKVQLSQPKECNEELLFGNRRASANGFYKANATITKDVVKDVALNFDFKAVEDEAKYILDNFGNLSARQSVVEVAKLGVAALTGFNARVPRLGVQTQWKDAVSGEWKNYVSEYSIAAVSAKPLGFNALNVLDNQYDSKIIKVKNALTAKERAYQKEIENYLTIQLGISGMGDIEYDETTQKVYLKVRKDKLAIGLNDLKNSLNKIINYINSQPTPPSPLIATIDDLPNADVPIDITDLFSAFAQIQTKLGDANTKIQNVLDRLISIQNTIFDKVAAAASAPSRYIQAAMLASNDDLGFFYPSRTYFAPTQVKAGKTIKLYPTSLTGEVLAPAFKKYVAILAGPTDGKNYNDNLEGLNTILSGNQYNLLDPIEITLTEKGVYEFIYEAIGYNGIVSGKKYYIEVY